MGEKKIDNTSFVTDFEKVELSEKMFTNFSGKVYELAGIDLPSSPKNHALLRNRVVKILRRRGFKNYEEYWNFLGRGDADVMSEFVSAMTTNMTSFFRESSHFELFSQVLPELNKKFGNNLRIWCAAASTGQEPYTIAVTIKENQSLLSPTCRVRLLATDIDLEVLKKASKGVYDDREMQGLPPSLRAKYFERVQKKGEEFSRAKDNIHELISFAPFNLIDSKYEFKFKFHTIFCRNVLIYFDEQTTKKVIGNLVDSLEVGGYLILGHSESGNVKHASLKPLTRAVYQKV